MNRTNLWLKLSKDGSEKSLQRNFKFQDRSNSTSFHLCMHKIIMIFHRRILRQELTQLVIMFRFSNSSISGSPTIVVENTNYIAIPLMKQRRVSPRFRKRFSINLRLAKLGGAIHRILHADMRQEHEFEIVACTIWKKTMTSNNWQTLRYRH